MQRVRGQLVGLDDDLDAAVVRREQLLPFARGLAREDRGELAAHARLLGRRADDLGDHRRTSDRGVERDPEFWLERADREPAIVGGAIHAVAREPAVQRLDAARGMRAAIHVAELGGEQRERALGHRDVEVRAAAGALASEQRAEDRGRAPQRAAGEIRDLHAGHRGRPSGGTAHREHARERDVIEIVAGAMRVRPGLAVAADRAHDDLRVLRRQRRVAEAELVHHAGTKALDDDVGALDHRQQRVALRRHLEIERERALAAVDREVACGHAALARRKRAQVIADARILDLDDVRAHVGEDHRQVRTGKQAREVEDLRAAQRVGERPAALGHLARSSRLCSFIASVGSPATWSLPWKNSCMPAFGSASMVLKSSDATVIVH